MENPRSMPTTLSRYENQHRDSNMFGQYLRNHRLPFSLARCSGVHFGHPSPPAPCPCPLRQAWGSLDALIGRLCAAFEENEGKPESNPFGALSSDFTSAKSAITRKRSGAHPITLPILAVRFKNPSDLGDGCRSNQMNLRKIRDSQSKARGINYEKKKRRPPYYSSDLGRSRVASTDQFPRQSKVDLENPGSHGSWDGKPATRRWTHHRQSLDSPSQ
ncbi:hypothetical protein RJ640_023996, partial [Escallonia rubra]